MYLETSDIIKYSFTKYWNSRLLIVSIGQNVADGEKGQMSIALVGVFEERKCVIALGIK